MAQMNSDLMTFMPAQQRFLQKQGLGARSAAVQKRFVKKWALWVVLVTLLALFYVWSRVQVIQLGYELNTLKRQNEDIGKQISNLELDIAKLKSPKRLEEVARKELGMQPPAAEQIVLVRPDEELSGH